MRKVISLIANVCERVGVSDWRQSAHNIKKLKKLYRNAQRVKRSRAKKKERVEQKEKRILKAHREYVQQAQWYLEKSKTTLDVLVNSNQIRVITLCMIEDYMRHADRQIDQIRRRIFQGERIPHKEKVFSIFEEHTEWISKGKAGVPQELGLKVCVIEDQYKFILHHMVMRGSTDDKVAVSITKEAKSRYGQLRSCSYDKNFYTPENKRQLGQILDHAVLPKKGKRNQEEIAFESSEDFVRERKRHPAVESGINALENHGLDRCFDHGFEGFKRYVALAIVARNIQTLGTILWKQQEERFKRKQTAYRKVS